MRRVLRGLGTVACSLGTSCVLLSLLGVLTWLGTLEQTRSGLYDVQKKYFESFVLLHDFGPFSLPLPGANLVMCLLFVNLVAGGMVRLRKDASTVGILIAHVGIALLFVAALVKHRFSEDGHVTLYEGQRAAHFESWFRWELAVIEDVGDGRVREHVVPSRDFERAADGVVRATSKDLPFAIEIERKWRNCRPQRVTSAADQWTFEGVTLVDVPPATQAEANIAGACVAFVDDANGMRRRVLAWGAESKPCVVTAAGRAWAVELRKERYPMPFAITLERFEKEDHPRSDMPKSFASDVSVSAVDDGASSFASASNGVVGDREPSPQGPSVSTSVVAGTKRDVRISMNQPLRDGGLVLYQASWGPASARPGDRLFSTFAVVRNPADQWPLIACIVIALGLVVHFSRKLYRYVRAEARTT